MNRVVNVAQVIRLLEKWAPKKYAYDWDNVGLQIGSYEQAVTNCMVTLDVTESVVDEAIAKEANLIIAHHPLLFKPLKQIDIEKPIGKLIQKIIKNDISVYAAHTNLDVAPGGVNDLLADQLGLVDRKVLVPTIEEKRMKLIVYVPRAFVDPVYTALANKGAGFLGEYSHCSFRSEGVGTFYPLSDADPFIGEREQLTTVEEVKLEMLIQESQTSSIIATLRNVHPYEEPAFDLIELENDGNVMGIGRVGRLKETMDLRMFCEFVKKNMSVQGLRVTGNLTKKIQKVAILGGSGEKYIQHAKRSGADVYVTGDMSFHQAQDAEALGLAVVDPGHHVEKVMIEGVRDYISKEIEKMNADMETIATSQSTEPFYFI